jgi:type III restriction enzyme
MNISLKDFQIDYVAELRDQLNYVRALGPKRPAAALLNAPTGAGKTVMATVLIEELLHGAEFQAEDPDITFLWLTDQPELNKQTYDKMLTISSQLLKQHLVIIDAELNQERLDSGRVYFLNTQKLGAGTSFVKTGDKRDWSLWQTIQNTFAADPAKFILIVDEAHRGSRGREAEEAETILQKFLIGSRGEIEPVPVVLGISATPERFVNLCSRTTRPLFQINVDPERVRESGLLKDYVDLFHPDKNRPADVTMLIEAVADWKQYQSDWSAYEASEGELTPDPVLVVQVEDARASSNELSRTDLASVVGTLARELGKDATDGWIAHAFQEEADITIAGHTIRYLAPSAIDADPSVKLVLFKTSLNTGWDCPRAEVMVSFRTARDETNIAQLVGRMVRAPLARRIISNEHLNTVALYLPFYDRTTVERVVIRLTSDPGIVPPTEARKGRDVVTLVRAKDQANCFEVLRRIPSYTVPRARPLKAVPRLGKLAALLAETKLESDPVKDYRRRLVDELLKEVGSLEGDETFKASIDEASALEVRRRRVAYGVHSPNELATIDKDLEDAPAAFTTARKAVIADENVDDLFAEAGRQLGEGLHKEYLRSRVAEGISPRRAKLELYGLATTNGVLGKLDKAADSIRTEWSDRHKAALASMDEKYRLAFREIESAGPESQVVTIDAPKTIEVKAAKQKWRHHLYVDDVGVFPDDFSKSSWESRTIEAELERRDLAGWLRNPDRKEWSLTITRREGTRWIPFFPDFIFFAQTPGGILPEIVDPHLLAAEDMPQRAVRLAQYAQDHGDVFRRIEMVIFESPTDEKGLRLDLMNETVRATVANVTTREQLKRAFRDLRY